MTTPLHNIRLVRVKNKDGVMIPGLWECDSVKLEAVNNGWACYVPMRRIGDTNFFEFRSLGIDGVLTFIGTYRTKDDCCIIAERLQRGTHVLNTTIPQSVVRWCDFSFEIARRTSKT